MNRTIAALILLSALTFFVGLGRQAITDSDEAYYAEAGREMVQSGDWLTPHYNFDYRFQKPILFYWLVASTYVLTGVHEAAARFWAAAAGLGLTLLTFTAGRKWFDEESGTIAGTIAATSFGYFALARLALPDLPLAFFVTLATFAAFEAVFEKPSGRNWWSAIAGAAAGLGFLTKGPVAIVLPALIIGTPCLLARRRPWATRSSLLIMSGAFVLVAAPWYVAMVAEHGTTYLAGFFVGDNIERFATSRFNEPRSVFFYVPVILGGMLPWTPFALLSVQRPSSRGRRPVWDSREVRLLFWALVPLLFFSVSIGKQPRYVLPILPPVAILIGTRLARRVAAAEATGGTELPARLCAAISGLLFVLLGILTRRAEPIVRAATGADGVTLAATVIALSGLATILMASRARLRSVLMGIAISAVVTFMSLTYGVFGSGGHEPVERMAAVIATHRLHGEPIGAFRVMVRNLVFYTRIQQTDLFDDDRAADFLRGHRPVLCVMTAEDRARLAATNGIYVRTLFSMPYANLATLKVGSILSNDPASTIQTVELVTNQ